MNEVTPDNAARATPVAWLVTNGGQSCEPWLVYERSELDAHPADCIADPLYSAATVAALEAEVRELTADRDSWIEQAYDRVADWDKERQRADAAERRLSEVREIQRTHYGDGVGLHLAMIRWARDYDALTGARAK